MLPKSTTAAAVTTLAVVTGCSSSTPATPAPSSTPGPSSTPAPTTSAASPSSPAAGAPAAGSAAGVPALSGKPTDVNTEAVISPGGATPPTALATADIVAGTGAVATAAATVDVRYTGALFTDGKIFDSSWKRGTAPVSFPLNRVVPGFAKGIEGMKVGGRREIVIPPDLGYGAQTNGPIPGGSTLVFVVDLVAVK